MANAEHLKILRTSVEGWYAWRKENPEIGPDLTGANLNDANLCSVDLTDADLMGAFFTEACLTGADLADADLSADAHEGHVCRTLSATPV